ncbi:MAG: family 2 encapsulin nanocompartment cargo protein polyprenyl transferase [Actinocrinis sp.]
MTLHQSTLRRADHEDHDASVLLARARRHVDPVLRAAVDTLPPAMRRVTAYHLGWQHADGTTATGADPGKAIRPALVLAATRAFGATPAAAARAAAAVELVHNFSLLHDDVMDRDTTRRHRPTAWTVFGAADAILAGDAVHALALRLLADDRHRAAPHAAARLAACVIELCEGQHADCSFETRDHVSIDECMRMALGKTGALLGATCAIGALYAAADRDAVEAMDAFGREVGLAFQLVDDLIGIWGDPEVTGKPAGADLAARKKSLPVVAALAAGGPAARELAALYRSADPMDPHQIQAAADAVDRAGGRVWAHLQAADHMSAAIDHLTRAAPDAESAEDLLTLAELVTRRER